MNYSMYVYPLQKMFTTNKEYQHKNVLVCGHNMRCACAPDSVAYNNSETGHPRLSLGKSPSPCVAAMADQEPPNYSGMLEHYKLEPSSMTEKCTDAFIKAFATRMTKWKLDPLSLGSEKVESIDRECSTEEEKKLKYLKSWKDNLDYKATYELLVQKLLEAGNASLAGVACYRLTPMKGLPRKEHEDAGE